ncbi:hypothetical protein GCM10009117_11260 [Gangjinia marincola]|uniref:Uncharacterized protein n=2 Tax=Gangjinia marincola TaxID=578463 RepID=A0ABN1MFP0_9FLAO
MIENKAEMCQLLAKMSSRDQLHRSKIPDAFSGNEIHYSIKEIDSINVLQRKIDNHKTKKLIEITKKYGWISNERIDCTNVDIWIIFRHSKPTYFDDISELIEKNTRKND